MLVITLSYFFSNFPSLFHCHVSFAAPYSAYLRCCPLNGFDLGFYSLMSFCPLLYSALNTVTIRHYAGFRHDFSLTTPCDDVGLLVLVLRPS